MKKITILVVLTLFFSPLAMANKNNAVENKALAQTNQPSLNSSDQKKPSPSPRKTLQISA